MKETKGVTWILTWSSGVVWHYMVMRDVTSIKGYLWGQPECTTNLELSHSFEL
jgi:hypothetical protein